MEQSEYPKVHIVVLNFNRAPLLERHLPSVLKTSYPNYKVIVVDNGSNDNSLQLLKRSFPSVHVIRNQTNLGFGRANNVAFRQQDNCDYFALLNNDVEVSPGWLTTLIETMETHSKVGAVGPRVLYSKKREGMNVINSAGGVVDRYDRGFDRYEGCPDGEQYATVDKVDFVTGGAVVLRRDAVIDVGGFDERMFFYYEDVDLCLRLREKGWGVLYDGRSTVYHDHMGTVKNWSSGKVTLASNANRIKSILRRKGYLSAAIESVRSPLEWLIYSLYGKITGKTYRERLLKNMFECRTVDE